MKAKENTKTAVTSTTKKEKLVVKGTEKIKTTASSKTKPKIDDDILEGAGLFKFKNNQELLKKWKIVNPERYELKLSTEKKTNDNLISLSKKGETATM